MTDAADDVVRDLRALHDRLDALLARAAAEGDVRAAAQLAGQLRASLDALVERLPEGGDREVVFRWADDLPAPWTPKE